MEYCFDKSLWPLVKSHLKASLHVFPGTTSGSGGDGTNRECGRREKNKVGINQSTNSDVSFLIDLESGQSWWRNKFQIG